MQIARRESGKSVGRGLAVPAPPLPADHPLVALTVIASSPRGLSGQQWQLLGWPQLDPVRAVFVRLRADVEPLHASGAAHAVRARTDTALAELAQVVAEHYSGRETALRRFMIERLAHGPLRSHSSDDKQMDRLIRREQNRIDHRNRYRS